MPYIEEVTKKFPSKIVGFDEHQQERTRICDFINKTAEELYNQGPESYEDAGRWYTYCLKIDPNYIPALQNIGNICRDPYYERHDFKLALTLYQKIVEIHEESAEIYFKLGQLFEDPDFKDRNIESAKKNYTSAIMYNPEDVDSHYNLAMIYERKDLPDKNYEMSRRHYEAVINIDPNYVDAYNSLGCLYSKSDYEFKNYQKSREYYDQAIYMNPKFAKTYNNLGVQFQEPDYEYKDYNQARISIEMAIKHCPDYAIAYLNLSNLQKLMEDQNEGRHDKNSEQQQKLRLKCLERYFELRPYDGIVKAELKEVRRSINQTLIDSIRCLEKFIKLQPDDEKSSMILNKLKEKARTENNQNYFELKADFENQNAGL